MVTKSENLNTEKYSRKGTIASSGAVRKKILPTERWLLITEKAYYRAQRRGFVGGDPFDDWAEAEREVDAIYDTDSQHVFVPAEAKKMAEQVNKVFGGFGLGHLSLDAILEKHRGGLERLHEHNQKVINSTSDLAARQTALFQDAVSDAMETLHSFTQGKVSKDGFAKQADLSARAIENVLSYFKDLTASVGEISQLNKKTGDGGK